MKGFEIADGRIRIVNGNRVVATTDGTLVCLLPTLREFQSSLSYPHPAVNDHCYAWAGQQVANGSNFDRTQTAQVYFSSVAEEVESATTLMAAPDGADVFFGSIRLVRTTEPTHTWCGQSLMPLLPEGEWVPFNGSGLIEAALGIGRLIHLVIEGGALKLIAQQSVGPASGGQDHSYGFFPGVYSPSAGNRSGGDFQSLATPGLLRWTSTDSPYRKVATETVPQTYLPGFYTLQRGQSGQCDTVDPTNYLSEYAVDVRGYFGRRS